MDIIFIGVFIDFSDLVFKLVVPGWFDIINDYVWSDTIVYHLLWFENLKYIIRIMVFIKSKCITFAVIAESGAISLDINWIFN